MENTQKIFDHVLNRIYPDFFKKMVNDPLLRDIFKNKDLKEIKNKQIKGISEFFQLYSKKKLQTLQKDLVKLGQLHEKIGVDFSLYIETVNKLELLFIKELFNAKPDDIEEYFFFYTGFFETVKNYTAYGFLKNYIRKERSFLRDFFNSYIKEKSVHIKDIIDKHILWEENVLEFLTSDTDKPEFELDKENCNMGRWLKKIKKENPVNIIQKIDDLHTTLHSIAENITFLKNEKKYTLLINEYNHFIKINMLFLSSLLAFLLSREIKQLQKDPLTKLFTRSILGEIYQNILQLSLLTGQSFGFAFLDIDDFKQVNDRYGHSAGDTVLSEIAQILKENLRKSDYLFRYGGEEFIIIMPSTSRKDFVNILEKLRKELEKSKIRINSGSVNVTVSIGGIIISGKKAVSLEKAIETADRLMYRAKKEGKNRVIVDVT